MAEAVAYASIDALPPVAETLLQEAPFQSGAAWWRCVEAAALPAGVRPHFLLCTEDGRATALLALQRDGKGRLSALTTPYTVTWAPLLTADDAATRQAGEVFGAAVRRWPVLHLDALDPDQPGFLPLLAGLRRAGWHAARFEHFGNWTEPVAGRDWAAYLAGRPGALRETVRRKQGRAERDPHLACECVQSPDSVDAGIAAYQDVYARSWKVPEPFPKFDAALLRAAAERGALRLGLMRFDDTVIAAQYWIVDRGTALVLKLAHDEAHRAHSPGTVLTAWMIRRLLDEGVALLDFGRGDDSYKRLWTSQRRPRIGLVLARPTHPAGLLALGRQWAGSVRRRLRRPAIGEAGDGP